MEWNHEKTIVSILLYSCPFHGKKSNKLSITTITNCNKRKEQIGKNRTKGTK